jgi:hypothetical protein
MDPTLQRVYVDPEICPTDQGGIMSLPPLDLDEQPPQPEPPDVLRFRSPEDPAA